MEKELDDVNLKILDILQRDARTPVKQIAAEVCLSSPAVSARIERMEEENLISGYHVKLNYHQFGYFIKAFINLEVEPKQKPEFYPFPQVSVTVLLNQIIHFLLCSNKIIQ